MTTATAEPIAKDERVVSIIHCPVCKKNTELKLSPKTRRVYTAHTGCSQIFARSDDADEKLRSMIVSAPAPAAPSPSTPTQGNKPGPAPKAERQRDSWDFLS